MSEDLPGTDAVPSVGTAHADDAAAATNRNGKSAQRPNNNNYNNNLVHLQAEEEQSTLMLRTMLERKDLHDTKMTGSDGATVTANLCVMVDGSDWFCKESKIDSTKKDFTFGDYQSTVLKNVVRMVYLGDCILPPPDYDEGTTQEGTMKWCEEAVSTCKAYEFFGIHNINVGNHIDSTVREILHDTPHLAPTLLDTCHRHARPPAEFEEEDEPILQVRVWDMVLECVTKEKIDIVFCSDGGCFQGLSRVVMEKLVSNQDIDAYYRFKLLKAWDDANNRDGSLSREIREMAKGIPIDQINPSLVQSDVQPSGYYSDNQMLEAWKELALIWSRKRRRKYSQRQGVGVPLFCWGKRDLSKLGDWAAYGIILLDLQCDQRQQNQNNDQQKTHKSNHFDSSCIIFMVPVPRRTPS
ncbi:unknown protein [Seminavis robusta]|uniref:Uncharacterized protein n=1 Tax=Seminavis robusta TaxID=568900 RepID=A0A9N8ES28_9STRA|nr:unknown protein [Seminavis robusta]|eukprot:Sro1526_g279760.1 n/a (410) ;mRNA; r:9503-10732